MVSTFSCVRIARRFLRQEAGAVSADFTVLTAVVVSMGLVAAAIVSAAGTDRSQRLGDEVAQIDVGPDALPPAQPAAPGGGSPAAPGDAGPPAGGGGGGGGGGSGGGPRGPGGCGDAGSAGAIDC